MVVGLNPISTPIASAARPRSVWAAHTAPPAIRTALSPNNCGGCTTANFSFDFSTVQEDAEIVSAKLAVFVLDNQAAMSQTILKGRKNIGGDYAVVAGAPVMVGNWALYDITSLCLRGRGGAP